MLHFKSADEWLIEGNISPNSSSKTILPSVLWLSFPHTSPVFTVAFNAHSLHTSFMFFTLKLSVSRFVMDDKSWERVHVVERGVGTEEVAI